MRLIGLLEAHRGRAAGCLVGLAVAVAAVAVYGIPWGARVAAFATPPGVLAEASERSLALLDDRVLAPSRLRPARRQALRAAFRTLTDDLGSAPFRPGYRLVFRAGGSVGPNAFALPSGLVVVTDELVRLAESDREILSALAHEVGRVEGRHGLRSLYGSTGVFVLVSVLLGDVVSAGPVAAGCRRCCSGPAARAASSARRTRWPPATPSRGAGRQGRWRASSPAWRRRARPSQPFYRPARRARTRPEP